MNLSGAWTGFIDDDARSFPFSLTLTDTDGVLTGMTEELNVWGRGTGELVYGQVHGHRDGPTVNFRKVYELEGEEDRPVIHIGFISEDGWRIEGRWIVAGDRSGRFMLDRVATAGMQEAAALWVCA